MWIVRILCIAQWVLPILGQDCDITIPRQFLPATFARAVPVATSDGLVVVFQEGPEIRLARFSQDCKPQGDRLVYQSDDFWREPPGSGLQDATALPGGAIALSWVMGGDVFVSLISVDGQGEVAQVRANNESTVFRHRSQVSIAASTNADDGFAVAWASWQQDGDAWGVFARSFSAAGQPTGDARQVNVYAKHFQWQPQLAWCQSNLWALWDNRTTGAPCGGDSPVGCATGPVLRNLNGLLLGKGAIATEVKSTQATQPPLVSTLACTGEAGAITPLWLAQEGVGSPTVNWDSIAAPSSSRAMLFGLSSEEGRGALHTSRLRRLSQLVRHLFAGLPLLSLVGSVAPDGSQPPPGSILTASTHAETNVFLTASSGLLVVVVSDSRGVLVTQLVDYGSSAVNIYPPRPFAQGVSEVTAVWDTGLVGRLALVLCYTTGDELASGNSVAFVCSRRGKSWLSGMNSLDTLDMALTLALGLMIPIMTCVLVAFWVLRHCYGAGAGRRRAVGPRLRELRAQLSTIPEAPPTLEPPAVQPAAAPVPATFAQSERPAAMTDGQQDMRAAGATPDFDGVAATPTTTRQGDQSERDLTSWGQNSAQGECSICQNEVVVRVALRPCGHTACRNCVGRVVEINQRCHICRAMIEGLQPVYI